MIPDLVVTFNHQQKVLAHPSDCDLLALVERNLIASPVVELRGARRCVVGDPAGIAFSKHTSSPVRAEVVGALADDGDKSVGAVDEGDELVHASSAFAGSNGTPASFSSRASKLFHLPAASRGI